MRATRVLCIDDDPSILECRKLLLESKGYSVLTTTSGTEALNLISRDPSIDLVLLDYAMPGMNGDELAEKLRQKVPTLPLVAVSGFEEVPERLSRNVDASITKGLSPEVLLATIAKCLCKSEDVT